MDHLARVVPNRLCEWDLSHPRTAGNDKWLFGVGVHQPVPSPQTTTTMNLQLHDNTANASASSAVDAHRPLRADGVINMRAALPMRTEWKVALWNVRTMLSDGAPELVARTLAKRNIKMACLCELRIAGSGRKVIDVPVRDGEEFAIKSYELLYSGPTDGKG